MSGSGSPQVPAIRYGRSEPLPNRRALVAGPLSAVLEDGTLRYIRCGDREIVRQIYIAVRDRNWGTLNPKFEVYEVSEEPDSFAVRLRALTQSSEIDFEWEGEIIGTRDGHIRFAMKGTARGDLEHNRIGFCVLHPMELAGVAVEVVTPQGRTVKGQFPERISPHQPFLNIAALRHPVRDGVDAEIRFTGEVFEMEDQRNWTDASYKTYCTPIGLPFPVKLREGQTVEQSVTVRLVAQAGDCEAVPTSAHLAQKSPGTSATGSAAAVNLRVESTAAGKLPELGLVYIEGGGALGEQTIELLRVLRLGHLRVLLKLGDADWPARLDEAAAAAVLLHTSLDIELLAGSDGIGEGSTLEAFFDKLSGLGAVEIRLFVFPDKGFESSAGLLAASREYVQSCGLPISVGGGTRAYYTQLNRAVNAPMALMDFAAYTINPQVHAFDNATLIESLPMQSLTARNSLRVTGGLPLRIGPVTLKPRMQPTATGPTVKPRSGELPLHVDYRHPSLFCAGWTIGSLRHLAVDPVQSVTYYDTTGLNGVMAENGRPYPVYRVFAEVADYAGADVLAVSVDRPLEVQALALRSGNRIRVLVAQFTNEPVDLRLAVPAYVQGNVRHLDETTWEPGNGGVLADASPVSTAAQGRVSVRLLPFGAAVLDLTL